MRSYLLLAVGLLLLCFLEVATAGPLHFNARQDDTPSAETSQTPAATSATSSREPSSAAESEKPTPESTHSERRVETLATTTARSTISATPSIVSTTTTTVILNGDQPSGTSEAKAANPLPIHPKITPAIGVAGAILLITGVVYAVIGIRKQWLYVFFSAAYLASLAVTVLIIYLMNPPVSDAVQGGFFVASILTGLLFGALSLIFSDITDGLGCLLGGFCLSMWFLTLREGALIRSTVGRPIFIGCMSAAVFSLSLSHYTRTYAIIGSIAFSGATITMLGIDCFCRAGLKEFWLYIWNLNPDNFPLHTNTYPLTRGIKVEIACVVLFTVFGVISQIRLWKVVRERREKNAVARMERDQEMQREEEEVGRRINNNLTRERAQWEAIYGDKAHHQDSITDSSHKDSAKMSSSFQEKDGFSSESVEMVPWPGNQNAGLQRHTSNTANKHASTGPSVTVTVLREEDEIERIDDNGQPLASISSRSLEQTDPFNTAANSARVSSDVATSGETRTSLRSSVSPPPMVVPLPFTIPTEEKPGSEEHDNASVSVAAESAYEPAPHRPLSKRLSGGSILKRLSMRRSADDLESLIVPHIEDDRASSLAATLDDEFDKVSLANLSAPGSEVNEGHEGPYYESVQEARADASDGVCAKDWGTDEHPESGLKPSTLQSLTISTDPISTVSGVGSASPSSPRMQHSSRISTVDEVEEGDEKAKSTESAPRSPTSQVPSPSGLSKDALPEKLSKVALSYRTNEWAKHLELAEQPELEDLSRPGSPGVKLSPTSAEHPAPVNDETKGGQPEKIQPKRTSTGSKPYRNTNLMRSTSDMSRTDGSTRGVSAKALGTRSSSTPFPTHSLENIAAARVSNTPSPILNNTLLGKRESLTRNKISSSSLTPLSSSSNLLSSLDQENMTLAQRKQLIQQQKPPMASQQWRQSSRAIVEQSEDFDSHQPRRMSGGVDPNRREVMLAGWRESMRREGNMDQSTTSLDVEKSRRAALIQEKQQKEIAKHEQALKAQQRETMLGDMMRSGKMLDAHREAMRRMQAKANRNV